MVNFNLICEMIIIFQNVYFFLKIEKENIFKNKIKNI